ncbi:hypothetical protein CFP56_003999 [Quercus suber]|uniref:Uncharacterized protein n=1 Tax=Quercus suber TaxID=58331 RepID=A0AAW0LB28_QUESU
MLRSYNVVKVPALVVPDNKAELSRLSDPEDALEEVMVASGFFWAPRTLRSMKSEIKPGFVILLSSKSILPLNILTTVDMDGRSFGASCVQRRPIFRNLQASSTSKSPLSAVSTSTTNSRLGGNHQEKEALMLMMGRLKEGRLLL